MKKNFLSVTTLILCLFTTFKLFALDTVKDEFFIQALTSENFTNLLFDYEFEGQKYPIRIIHNPKKEMLWGEKFDDEPTAISLIVIAHVPIPLERYIEDLILELRGSYEDSQLELTNGSPKNNKYGWNTTQPIHLATRIKDPINDEIIATTYQSKKFENKVIYYQLDKNFYQVRLLHNPEEKTFTEVQNFNLKHGPIDITFTWNKKYAILIDIEAPQALVDHLSNSLRHLNYWDWYFKYTLSNGTEVPIRYDNSTTYFLDSWFIFTENFHES